MKKSLCTLVLCLVAVLAYAQGPRTAYCEIVGNMKAFNENEVTVSIDFGDLRPSKRCRLLDENAKKIKFETMMQVVNYMSKRGWKLANTYFIEVQTQYRYVMSKEIDSEDEMLEGILVDRKEKK